jgi:hypothetical protein
MITEMNELGIICSLESPQEKNSNIVIGIENNLNEELLYKYIIGCNGTWNTLKDFSSEAGIKWNPIEEGIYTIMVQAKKKCGEKSFDYVSKMEYSIGMAENKLIDVVTLDKYTVSLGEKVNLFVSTSKFPLMFRYWIKERDKWRIIKDYSADNTLLFAAKWEGKGQILVECKNIDSKKEFDDSSSVEFQVKPLKNAEIIDFRTFTSDLVEDCELMFQVETSHEKDRNILYKFIKINSKGEAHCIQDYSTQRTVSYIERESGDYKLLCMIKDMYSTKSFDDRAVINFNVKKYKEIFIKNFTTDLSSPQLSSTPITLKAEIIGGKEVLYRYIIEGPHRMDTGYTRDSSYTWEMKTPGNYKICLWIKDKSFEGNFEAVEYMNYTIDEESKEPVKIDEVLMDKQPRVLCNEKINVKVNASGGNSLRYHFIINKDNKLLEEIKYGSGNWIDFIPKEKGIYELEVRVRDRYSDREFDCHSTINIEVFSYIPAKIEHVLFPFKENYLVGDKITLNSIATNTNNTIVKYVLKINKHKVEETEFVEEKSYVFTPKCSGIYTIEIFAKSKDADKPFDCKKHVQIEVREALPITNTKLSCDNVRFLQNKSISFSANSEGGKDVVYEFYIMEKGDWRLAQSYSKKDYYDFIPFSKDQYKILVLAKSQHTKLSYEDYDMVAFSVE